MNRVTTLSLARDLRSTMDSGSAFGGWCMGGTSLAIETIASVGYDFMSLDMQHGLQAHGHLHELVRAADVWNIATLVRVPWSDAGAMMQALDAGAAGIIVPMINCASDAERVVSMCRFPPVGQRSWGPLKAAIGDPGYLADAANDDTLLFVMIETEEALRNAEEIVAVDGVDGVFIGPTDLTLSLTGGALPGRANDDRREEAVSTILSIIKKHGKYAGYSCPDGLSAQSRAAEGFDFLPVGSDVSFLSAAAAAELRTAKATANSTAQPSGRVSTGPYS